MVRPRTWLAFAAFLAGACSSDRGDPDPDILADLRADSNRDGAVSFDDDSDKEKVTWNASAGAVFLANIDDDTIRCKADLDDILIAQCNDASDEIINGDADAQDIARMKTRPWPKTPPDAQGTFTIDTVGAQPHVRLFWRSGPNPTDLLPVADDTIFTADEIRAGIELGIEAKDIVRDAAAWDGYVDVRFNITSPSRGDATDVVRMRVAPVLTYHHLLPAEAIWVSNTKTKGNAYLRKDLEDACTEARVPAPLAIDVADPWSQDYFETGYMSMPGMGGMQHVIRVNYRSANVFQPEEAKHPLRPAGQVVFAMRGPDVAGIQQYDMAHDRRMDSLNSFGNLETVPPFQKDGETFPFGRVLRGRTGSFFPDQTFVRMIDGQVQQPAIDIDTSWLFVGHVDETLSFVKASTSRGWVLLANDARMAKKMLEDQVAAGRGDLTMFVDKSWVNLQTKEKHPAEIAIKDVLADTEVMRASAEAAAEVDGQVAILKREIGLADDEIVHVPFLHTAYQGRSIAYQPGIVNGIYLSPTEFAAPDPHGPMVDGKDIFKVALAEPLGKIGVTVHFVEDWDDYHVALGEVHCGTNTTRKVPVTKWWESGR
jgi:protein-arginine deiminase